MLSAEELRIRANEGLVLSDEAQARIEADDQAQAVAADTQVSDTARLAEQYADRMAEYVQARGDHEAIMRAYISSGEAYVQAYEAASAAARLTQGPRPLRLSVDQSYETRQLLDAFKIASRRPL